ncbi:MAG: ATP-dependent Clp protease ATP-binding subunit [Clostridia bacterium]|nr:ATP-dependent Clp protease ATP-binding subunit [Clostridia bacterium]
MQDSFTKTAEQVLKSLPLIAGECGHTYIGSEHLFWGLLRQKDSVTSGLLESYGLNEDKWRQAIKEYSGYAPGSFSTVKEMTPRVKHILALAASSAAESQSEQIGTIHLLSGLLEEDGCVALRVLLSSGVCISDLKNEVSAFLSAVSPKKKKSEAGYPFLKGFPFLSKYGKDMVTLAEEGRYDPLAFREKELCRVIRILSRRQKNNPCLVGEPGVGKTAIAEGLATRIAEGRVPDYLRNKRLIQLDLPAMLAGAKYRGEFEDRLKGVMEEVKKEDRILLFIDEMHIISGAGAAEGALDAANLLKPALSSGEIRVIGATTPKEYRLHIEKDSALCRRFEVVDVPEPSWEEAIRMLQSSKEKYEKHHSLQISQGAIEAAVRLSARYIHDRFLPDKAIDLIDEAAAEIRSKQNTTPKALRDFEQQLADIAEEKNLALQNRDFSRLSLLRGKENDIRKALAEKEKEYGEKNKTKQKIVTAAHIAEAVTAKTGIPVKALNQSEEARLSLLDRELHKRIIGQDVAVDAVIKAIKRSRLGLADAKRPIGSFLFLGPTGVGKTALSLALAECLFGSAHSVIRLDMTEYAEKHSVSKLIGSPPGYVGYEEGGGLTERIRSRPYSVVLFDEIEKAHPDVIQLLLQILEDGALTDSGGKTADFTNAVIILTSNAGENVDGAARSLGFLSNAERKAKEESETALKRIFRPEFLNRLDEIIHFSPLSPESLEKIASLELSALASRVKEAGMRLSFDPGIPAFIAGKDQNPGFGARPIRRSVIRYIEDPLSAALFSGELRRDREIVVSEENGKLVLRQKSPQKALLPST